MQGQLDCQPFFKAPRVPPAETPGIPKHHVDTVADPSSPVPRQQSAHLDDVVDSFVNNIISAVKLELTASAVTNNAGAATVAAAELPETSAPNAEHRSQEQDAADEQPISAVSSSQPAAATQHISSPINAVDTQQQPAAQDQGMHVPSTDPSAAEPSTDAVEAESVVQELLHGMLEMVASDETPVEVSLKINQVSRCMSLELAQQYDPWKYALIWVMPCCKAELGIDSKLAEDFRLHSASRCVFRRVLHKLSIHDRCTCRNACNIVC